MRSDQNLQQDVMAELKWDPSIREAEIGVIAKDGVVTLTGFCDTFAQKWAAQRAAERVSGVLAIADGLKVRPPGPHQRDDTELAHAIVNALKWDVEVPHERIKAKVLAGYVTLQGTVDWQYQRSAAERCVRYLVGVKGVLNELGLATRATAKDVSDRIRDALRRTAEADAAAIEVEATGGKVTLRGRVHSWSERQDAERAAWGAQGVTAVEDLLTVST